MTSVGFRVVFVGLCGALAAAVLWHAWSVEWSPDGLPTWDSAGYLLEAVRFRDDMAGLNLLALLKDVTRPDLHPPLHSFCLALWLLVAGNTLWAARVYPALALAFGLVWVAALGSRMHRRWGWEIGAAAALLAALGVENLKLLSTPMTESTTLPFQFAALYLAARFVDRTDARSRALVGVAILAATLVRYNLGPMLAAPLLAHHGWRHRRGLVDPAARKALLDPGVLLWLAPTLAAFAVWQLVRPDLAENIQKFLENRASGIPFWSAENLLWVPLQTQAAYLGSWSVVGGLFLAFTFALLPARVRAWGSEAVPEESERLVQWVVIAGFVALTLHDFKIVRNLAPVLPAFYLVALVPVASLRWPARVPPFVPRLASLGAVVLVRLGWQAQVTDDRLVQGADFRPDAPVRQALDFLVDQAGHRDRLWVVGYMFRLSPGLIEYWMKTHGVTARLELEQPRYGEQTRTGVDSSWNEQYATFVQDKMLAADKLDETTFVTIATAPGTHYFDDWKAYGNNYARAFAEQAKVPEVDRLAFVDLGLTLRVYRTNEAVSARSASAAATSLTAEDDAGLTLPAAAPLYRDAMRGDAATWLLYPPDAFQAVPVDRSGGALRLTIPSALPKLQLCDTSRPDPAPPAGGRAGAVRAVFNVEAEGLQGRAWVHLRGMDAQSGLQTAANGAPDIAQAGPLAAGAQAVEVDFTPGPTTTHIRACFVLDGAVGTVVVKDYALYSPDAPRLAAAVSTDGAALPEGVRFREAFDAGAAGWRLTPADAPGVTLTGTGGRLSVVVPSAVERLAACGPPIPWSGDAAGSVRVVPSGVHGNAWFHFRPLDAGGVLLKSPSGAAAIVQAGPVTGDGDRVLEAALALPAETRTVRPCLVLDGVSGAVALDDLTIRAPK